MQLTNGCVGKRVLSPRSRQYSMLSVSAIKLKLDITNKLALEAFANNEGVIIPLHIYRGGNVPD